MGFFKHFDSSQKAEQLFRYKINVFLAQQQLIDFISPSTNCGKMARSYIFESAKFFKENAFLVQSFTWHPRSSVIPITRISGFLAATIHCVFIKNSTISNYVTAKKGKSFIDRYSSKTSNSTREEV